MTREPSPKSEQRPARTAPVEELLIGCARSDTDARAASALAGRLQKPDWQDALRLAAAHRLMPLLHWKLRHLKDGSVPAEVMQQLSEQFQATAHYNLMQTRELIRVLTFLSAAGIEAIPYKGPILAQIGYGNLALRQFSDLDLLVDESQVLRANALLRSHGYRLDDELAGVHERRHLQRDCEFTFIREDGRVSIEIHWRVLPRFFGDALSYPSLAQRAMDLTIGGHTVHSLSPEDLLLVLCVHPIKHTWNQLNWIIDVAELIGRHPGLDWQWLMSCAETAGIRRTTSVGLTLAADLLGTPLPDEVMSWVRADRAGASLSARLAQRLFDAAEPGALETWHIWLEARERPRDRSRLYAQLPRLLVTPSAKDRAFVSLPPAFSALYYLIRPVRAAFEAGQRQAVARFHRSPAKASETLLDAPSLSPHSSREIQDLAGRCSPLP